MATTYVRSYAKENQVTLFRNMYGWMTMALVISALSALVMNQLLETSTAVQSFISSGGYLGLIVVEFILVIALTAGLRRFAFSTLTVLFILYSILNGVTLTPVLLIYTQESIVSTFFITAGAFGAMALYGSLTKRDLSSIGSIALMALIGLLIAMVVNLFLRSGMMSLIISCVGVVVFALLTLYDAQKYKRLISSYDGEICDEVQKIALMGAFELYLDFINMFLYLLRLLGSRK